MVGIATGAVPGNKILQKVKKAAGARKAGGVNVPNIAGRGSTGRIEPQNLQERLAMDEVMSNPQGRTLVNMKMTDPRWPSSEGWVKMQQTIETSNGKVNIHYLKNTKTGVLDDFKFKDN